MESPYLKYKHTKISSLVSFKTKTPTSPVLSEKRHQNVNGWKEFWSSTDSEVLQQQRHAFQFAYRIPKQ